MVKVIHLSITGATIDDFFRFDEGFWTTGVFAMFNLPYSSALKIMPAELCAIHTLCLRWKYVQVI